MRFPDRPDINGASDDIPDRAGDADSAGLAERLLRLPAGHPSGGKFREVARPGQHGADARLAPADGDRAEGHPDERDPEEAVSHLPWPDDWVRHAGPAEHGDVPGDLDDLEPEADAGGQPEGGAPGLAEGGEAGLGRPAAGAPAGDQPWAGRAPYRPWFSAADVAEPWFASEPDWPSPGQGG